MTLPANSTFLPILDDLLSPDLRPVLQTPTADYCGTPGSGVNKLFVIGSNGCSITTVNQAYSKGITVNGREQGTIPEECEQEASIKIQSWWRNRNSGFAPRRNSAGQVLDVRAERAKHSIRHNRTEDHIYYLETEVGRLKSALSSERKLRSLQLEAIRSLWGQVQKISSSDPNQSIMTQSMPNGLPISPPKKESHKATAMSMSFSGATLTTLDEEKETKKAACSTSECGGTCSKEIQLLRESLTSEISQLRDMITRLTVDGGAKESQVQIIGKSELDSDVSALSSAGEIDEKNKDKDHHPQRPLSLNIIGMSQGQGQADLSQQPEKKEISGYANQMANKLLEDAAVEKEDESTASASASKPISGESHF